MCFTVYESINVYYEIYIYMYIYITLGSSALPEVGSSIVTLFLQVRRLKFREDTQRGDFQGTPPEEKRGQNLNPVQILKSALSPPFCGQNQLSREFAIEGPPWAGPFPTRARIYSLQGGKPLSKMKK